MRSRQTHVVCAGAKSLRGCEERVRIIEPLAPLGEDDHLLAFVHPAQRKLLQAHLSQYVLIHRFFSFSAPRALTDQRNV